MVILDADDRRREGRPARKTGSVRENVADDRRREGDILEI